MGDLKNRALEKAETVPYPDPDELRAKKLTKLKAPCFSFVAAS